MLDLHTLGAAGGTGGVDDVREVRGPHVRRPVRRRVRSGGRAVEQVLDGEQGPWHERGEVLDQVSSGQADAGGGSLEDLPDPYAGVAGVERHVGGARLEDAPEGGHSGGGAVDDQSHQVLASYAAAPEPGRDGVGASVEFGVRDHALGPVDRGRVGGAGGLGAEGVHDGELGDLRVRTGGRSGHGRSGVRGPWCGARGHGVRRGEAGQDRVQQPPGAGGEVRARAADAEGDLGRRAGLGGDQGERNQRRVHRQCVGRGRREAAAGEFRQVQAAEVGDDGRSEVTVGT